MSKQTTTSHQGHQGVNRLTRPGSDRWTKHRTKYGYDGAKRLTGITTPAGAYAYAYDGTNHLQIAQITLPNGAYIADTYDDMARLLSTTLKNSGGSVLNFHGYTNNVGNQRIAQVFTYTNFVTYAYDNIGQLTSALGKEAGSGTNRLQEQMQYAYDSAHNLSIRTNNNLIQNFNVNSLNELTNATYTPGHFLTVAGTTTSQATNVTISRGSGPATAILYNDFTFTSDGNTLVTDGTNTFTAIAYDSLGRTDTNVSTVYLPATNSYSYDLNGNLLSDGTRAFDYDDENQLIRVTLTNAWKSEFTYDGRMRRRVTREFTWQYGKFIQTNEMRYVYDGNLVVQERDINNLPQVTYTRGKDLSGGLQGAGGIGGLLARRDRATAQTAFYHADGNGNVTALINAAQCIAAKYLYDPYGNLLSKSGLMADINGYRFSTKEYHVNSGLIYYGFRFYDPNAQRWLNRDPLREAGGVNLYEYVHNHPVGFVDISGRNAYVINGGGFSGHTAIAIDDPYGGVMVYHFYGAAYSFNQTSGSLRAVLYDKSHIWSQYYDSLGSYVDEMKLIHGSITFVSMAIGTVYDDSYTIDYLDWLIFNNDLPYSVLFGKQCHSWSYSILRDVYVGTGRRAAPIGIFEWHPATIGHETVDPPDDVWLSGDFLAPSMPSFAPQLQTDFSEFGIIPLNSFWLTGSFFAPIVGLINTWLLSK